MEFSSSPSSSTKREYIQKRIEVLPKICRLLFRSKTKEAFEISREYRTFKDKENNSDSPCYTYGEIDINSFIIILKVINRLRNNRIGGIFVDLGCGSGKALIVASLCPYSQFNQVIGIEIVDGLAQVAMDVKTILENVVINSTNNIKSKKITKNNDLEKKAFLELDENKKKIKNKTNLFFDVINGLLQSKEGQSIHMQTLANEVVKKVGHKVYKQVLKGCSSFKKWLDKEKSNMNIIIDEENGIVKLNTIESTNEVEYAESEVKFIKSIDEGIENEIINQTINVDDNNDVTTTQDTIEIDDAIPVLFHPLPTINVIPGDMFTKDNISNWKNADVIYAANLLFETELIEKMAEVFSTICKCGTIIVSLREFTNKNDEKLKLVEKGFFKMSWAMAQVFYYIVK